ncbi:putative uncharacterized protein [Streptococcus troglodytae]|uniref:Bacteriocin class II with double-glycine leader peptide n=1 Tax=Streptococcus troglodytae TaxID=1111760 RepID=A0A1L7LHA9_9STRE|nr:bacteriocin [Streptococcus troglodytae]BAQ23556.1 putative uncharacterized protein [Streptococcus troglodytae]
MNSLAFEEFETLGAEHLSQVDGSGVGLGLLYGAAYAASEAFAYGCAGVGLEIPVVGEVTTLGGAMTGAVIGGFKGALEGWAQGYAM